MQPFRLSALELLARLPLRAGLSPVEAMASVIARVEAFEPHIAATYLYRAGARARRGARLRSALAEGRADRPARRRAGDGQRQHRHPRRPDPARHGGERHDAAEAADAPPAARLREAGAILFAKTTMPDYGMLSSGLSSYHPLARNPWKLDRNPGGSSAGAGAAAAALYGPLHIGTDIGGSIRLPAGWCGIFGLKPSAGRVPIDPPYIGRVAGPMTRDVADAALMMATLSLPDARDYSSLKYETLDWAVEAGAAQGPQASASCSRRAAATGRRRRSARRSSARRATSRRPGRVSSRSRPSSPRRCSTASTISGACASLDRHRARSRRRSAPRCCPSSATGRNRRRGSRGRHVFRGFSQIQEMRKAAIAATHRFDFVLSPTAPMTAFPAEWASPSRDPLNPFPHIGFTVAFNMSEQPAASVNCGFDDEGLPIGLQIVGRRFDDVGVLAVARAYEAIRSAKMMPWPEPPDTPPPTQPLFVV